MPIYVGEADLNYRTYTGNWSNSLSASQGAYEDSGGRTGIIYFPDSPLEGMEIKTVQLSLQSSAAGSTSSKSVDFYRSAYQYIRNQSGTSGAAHRSGGVIGTITGGFYDNTLSRAANFLAQYLALGEKCFCIFKNESSASGYSANYLRWVRVTMTVDYVDPGAGTRIFRGVDGNWVRCKPYFGVDGEWKPVTLKTGVNGEWKV